MSVLTKAIKIGAVIASMLPLQAAAQSPFDTMVEVNNSAITRFEIDQRVRFLQVLNRPGDLRQQAIEGLIDDRLRLQNAQDAGISIAGDGMTAAMTEFAGRANMDLPTFTRFLAERGVDQATLRDFVRPAVLWREVVRTRFAGQATISEAEIDRALNTLGPSGGLRVLLSEIVLFAPPPEFAAQQRVAERLSQIRSTARFSAEAAQRSVSSSRENGGRLPWTNINDLPAPLRPIIRGLQPGEVTAPLTVENAFILFQLRDIQETTPAPRAVQSVEYMQLTVDTDRLASVVASLDTCDDIYGEAQRLGQRAAPPVIVPPQDVPTALAAHLAGLDANELFTQQVTDTASQITMLCGRSFAAAESVSREEVAGDLRQRRLSSLADGLIAELRASANIIYR